MSIGFQTRIISIPIIIHDICQYVDLYDLPKLFLLTQSISKQMTPHASPIIDLSYVKLNLDKLLKSLPKVRLIIPSDAVTRYIDKLPQILPNILSLTITGETQDLLHHHKELLHLQILKIEVFFKRPCVDLSRLKKIISLTIQPFDQSTADFSVEQLSTLQKLTLEDTKNETNTTLAKLASLSSLTSLSIKGKTSLTTSVLETMTNLRNLTINVTRESTLKYTPTISISQITSLELKINQCYDESVHYQKWSILKCFPNLKILSLVDVADYTHPMIRHIPPLPNLISLELTGNILTPSQLSSFRNLQSLTFKDFSSRTMISDARFDDFTNLHWDKEAVTNLIDRYKKEIPSLKIISFTFTWNNGSRATYNQTHIYAIFDPKTTPRINIKTETHTTGRIYGN